MIKIILFFSFLFICNQTEAQQSGELSSEPSWELATTTGVLLPSNVAGVTELLPPVQFSIDKSLTHFRLEGKYLFASSEGVKLRKYFLSIKNDVNLFDMNYFWYFGINLSEHLRNTIDYVDSNFIRQTGWHYGFGLRLYANKRVFIRSEIQASIRPGRMLYTGIGIGFSFGSFSKD